MFPFHFNLGFCLLHLSCVNVKQVKWDVRVLSVEEQSSVLFMQHLSNTEHWIEYSTLLASNCLRRGTLHKPYAKIWWHHLHTAARRHKQGFMLLVYTLLLKHCPLLIYVNINTCISCPWWTRLLPGFKSWSSGSVASGWCEITLDLWPLTWRDVQQRLRPVVPSRGQPLFLGRVKGIQRSHKDCRKSRRIYCGTRLGTVRERALMRVLVWSKPPGVGSYQRISCPPIHHRQ